MKKCNKAVFWFIIFVIIVVLIIPLIIHIIYKIEFKFEFLTPSWSSGEILQYYGSVIGAVLAIIGVFITLEHNRNENKKNLKQNVRPYLETYINSLKLAEEKEKIFDDYELVCVQSPNSLQVMQLSPLMGKDCIIDFAYRNASVDDYYVFKYTICNIGLGTLLSLKLNINDVMIIKDVNISKEKSFNIYIFIHREIINGESILNIELTYKDLFEDTVYKQTEKLNVEYNPKNDDFFAYKNSNDSLSKQVVIEDKNVD